MSSHTELTSLKARELNKSTNASKNSTVSIAVWLFRVILVILLILFIMPFALLLTPWWIGLQPFGRLCPNMMNGYYRIVTWPLTIGKNIRSYKSDDRFTEQLKY